MTRRPPTRRGRTVTLLVAFLCMAVPNAVDAFEWSPTPAPNASNVYHWEHLSLDDGELAPGETLRMVPERLSVYAVRTEPASLVDALELTRLFEVDADKRATVPLEPRRHDRGQLVFETAMHRRGPVDIRLPDEAERSADIRVYKLQRSQPRYFWIDWYRQLFTWVDGGAGGDPPEGLPVAGRDDVLQDLEHLQLLGEMIRRLEADSSALDALTHLGRALVVRAVERVRDPEFGYYIERPLRDSLPESLSQVDVQTGSGPTDKAIRLDASRDPVLEIEGPAQVHLGVRALQRDANPDARREYELTIRERGRIVQSREFSSRASEYSAVETDGEADEFTRNTELRAHYARQFEPVDEGTAGADETSETAAKVYGRTASGRVVSWRRRTRIWVPPGWHHFELDFSGAEVLLDGTVARPKTRVSSAWTGRMDPELQLLDVDGALDTSETTAALLLRAERQAYVHRWETASAILRDNRARLVEAGGSALDLWIQWRLLEWAETVTPGDRTASNAKIREWLRDDDIPNRLVRYYAFTLARRLPNRAYDVVSLFDRGGDRTPERLMRAEATLRSSQHPWDRWRGLADLYEWWRRSPADDRLEDAAQSHWWHRTYWRSLEPAGDPPSQEILEPAVWTDRQVHLADLAGRDVWYRIRPNREHRLRTEAAPDRPGRLARFRLQLDGRSSNGLDPVHIDGENIDILRTRPTQVVPFAAAPSTTQSIQHWIGDDSEDAPRVFVDRPPVDATEIDPTSVVDHEEYWPIDAETPRLWHLPSTQTARFARFSVRGLGNDDISTTVDCLFDDDRARGIRVDWSADGSPSEHPPSQFVLPVPPGAETLTVRSDEAELRIRVEIRAGRLPEVRDNEAIDVPVDLPVDQEDLDRIRRLSRAVRTSSGREAATYRIRRAKALMAIARNRLALVDLDWVMDRLQPGESRFRRARLLRRTVYDRLDSDWYDIEKPYLDDRSFLPLDLEAQLGDVPIDQAACGELLRNASTALQTGRAEEAVDAIRKGFAAVDDPRCRTAWRVLHVAATERTGNRRSTLASLDKLIAQWPDDQIRPWEARRKFADLAIRRIRRYPDRARLGLGVDAYLHAREALRAFPSSDVRSAWYGTLRWTGWETLRDVGGGVGVATGEFDPSHPPVNLEDLRLPVVDDPTDEAVDFALLGVDWARDDAIRLFGDSRRTLRYRLGDADRLVVQRAAIDHRPDLQPATAPPPHRILATLQGPDGDSRPSDTVGTAPEQGTQPSSTFGVGGEGIHRLELKRPDDVPGRLTFARVQSEGPSGRQTPRPMSRHQLLTVAPPRPGEMTLSGPTLLRLDARALQRLPAGRLVVRVTHLESGDTDHHTVDLPGEAQAGAALDTEGLGRARRLLVPVDRSGAHRIELEPKGGLATVRLWMRTDDRSGGTRPDGDDETPDDRRASVDRDLPTPDEETDRRLLPASKLPIDGVAEKRKGDWSLFGRTGWFRDDLNLADESTTGARDRPYLEFESGGAGALQSPETWGSGALGLRIRPGMPVVQQLQLTGDWRPDLWDLRVQPAVDLYHQAVDRPYLAARSELRIARSFRMSQTLWWLHGIRGKVRLQPNDAWDRVGDQIAPRVYSFYARDHPVTTDYLSLLWWRPFLDVVGYGMVQPVFNPDFGLDKIRFRAVARALFETTRVEVGSRLTWFRDDAGRDDGLVRHDLDVDGRLGYWARRGHLLSLGAEVRWSATMAPSQVDHDLSAGLRLSYWYTGDSGTRARPPTDLTFEELLEPRYFER